MVSIVSGILSLTQHLINLEKNPEKYKVEYCPQSQCGKAGLWAHGYRYRKVDRENNEQDSLNSIAIARRYCPPANTRARVYSTVALVSMACSANGEALFLNPIAGVI